MSMLMGEEEAAEAGRQVREERRDSPLPIHFNLNRERVFGGAIRERGLAGDADPGPDY